MWADGYGLTGVTDEISCRSEVQKWYDDMILPYMAEFDTYRASNYDFSPLPDGAYDIYFAYYGDAEDISYPSGLIIDLTPPVLTISSKELTSGDTISPVLKGSIDKPGSTIQVTLAHTNGTTYGPYNATVSPDAT